MLEFRNVSKVFDHQPVVNDVSFGLTPGEILGVLAPTAEGKTTIIRLAVTVCRADQGEIIFNNKTVKKLAAKNFGYIPQIRGVYRRARVINYLLYQGILNQLRRAQAHEAVLHCLDKYGLSDQADKRLGELNPDLREKIMIIGAILHEPDILVVDEPFAGFAAQNESLVRTLLIEFKQKNKLVLLATRSLDKAENICDRVCLLSAGKVILNMTMPEIRTKVRDNIYYLETSDDLTFLKALKEVQFKAEDQSHYKITIKDKTFDGRKLLAALNKNIKIIKFERFRPGLMYIYPRLVKNLQKAKK
jgi:ABC-2 type transport system ATP-binding protein